MKKLVLVLTVVLVLSGIFAVAALTQVEIDRNITATVASDTDANVAVLFTILNDYDSDPELATLTDDNEIEFDLAAALTEAAGSHYNTEATFVIGSTGTPVFSITNHTNVTIGVYTDGTHVQLLDDGGTPATNGDRKEIGAGDSEAFHFRLLTADALENDPGAGSEPISATLSIRQQ